MSDNSKNNRTICYILSFMIPVGIMVIISLIQGFYPFGAKSVLMADMRYQFVDYYAAYRRILFGNDDIFYSLQKTAGGDMAGLLAYYSNTPILFLLAFVPERALPGGILILMTFMLGLCGLNFNIFLNRVFGFRRASLIFSTAYAFNGFLMGYFNCTQYFFNIALLPLVMLGLIGIIKKERISFLYIISLSLSIFSSYYIGYMVCLFSILFFIYVFCVHHFSALSVSGLRLSERMGLYLKEIGKHIKGPVIYVLTSALSVGMSAVSLLCAVFSLRGQKKSGLNISARMLFDPLDLFSGLYTNAFHGNVSDGLPLIYCTVTGATLLFLFYLSRRITVREKLLSGLIFFVLIISFIFDLPNTVWHGFAHPIGFPHRFSFLFCFFALYLAYTCFIHIKDALRPRDYITVLGVFMLYSAYLILSRNEYAGVRQVILTFFCMSAVMAAFRPGSTGKEGGQVMTVVILAIVTCLDSGYNANASIAAYFNPDDPGSEDEEEDPYGIKEYQAFIDETKAVLSQIERDDEGLYRTEKHYRRSLNDAMMFGYNGLSHFSSCESDNIKRFMGYMGFRDNGNWAYYGEEGSTTFADCFMGVKYIISQYDEIPRPFTRVFEYNDKYVFKNPFALPLAFSMTKEAESLSFAGEKETKEELNTAAYEGGYDHFTWQNAIASAFDGKEHQIYRRVEGVSITTENLKKEGNKYVTQDPEKEAYIEYSFTADSDDTVFMYFDAPEVQDTQIIVNGLEKQPYFTQYGWNIRGMGIFGKGEKVSLKLYAMQDEIEIDGYEFYYEDEDALEKWYDGLGTGSVQKLASSRLKGSVSLSPSQELLVFSIPYDEGWSIWVDGEKRAASQAVNGLLAVSGIGPGEHGFELKYVPTGFRLGMPVSIVCMIIFGVLAVYVHSRFLVYKRSRFSSN